MIFPPNFTEDIEVENHFLSAQLVVGRSVMPGVRTSERPLAHTAPDGRVHELEEHLRSGVRQLRFVGVDS